MTASLAMRPLFRFTHHAVARFTKRVWPKISNRPVADLREVLAVLCEAANGAELMPRRSILGDALWSVPDPAMRWITKPDDYRGRRVALVVTILAGSDDTAAEERAEHAVIEAHQRLAAAPEFGLPEATSPAPAAGSRDYRTWSQLESQRLSLENSRLSAMKQHAHLLLCAEKERQKTRRHLESQAHSTLFLELLDRLAEVDPQGSAELVERARERVRKWAAEGKVIPGAEEPG